FIELPASALVVKLSFEVWEQTGLNNLPAHEEILWARYVETMISRRLENAWSFPSDQILRQVSWLASKMEKRSQTFFALDDLQPDWLESSIQRMLYSLL